MAEALETEQAESLQLKAYRKIKENILYAHYAPGFKLMVKDLCLDLDMDMGRTPIRESLVRLRQEGLVYAVPQSGTYVSRISLDAIECARFIREHLERQVAMECCTHATRSDYERLVEIIRLQKHALDEGDRRAFFDEDNHLHRTLFSIAGRERAWVWLESLSFDLDRYRWLRMCTEELDWNNIMNQHYLICDALASKDIDEVNFQTSAHLHLMFVENAAVFKAYPEYFVNDIPQQ